MRPPDGVGTISPHAMTVTYSIVRDASLRTRNTFRVEATASWLATVHDAAALPALLADARIQASPALVLGEGSNVLFAAEHCDCVIVHVAADEVRIIEDLGDCAVARAEAGCGWDALVDWTLDQGLCGLENLALIPGNVGAAPIQNIGAYGAEVGEFVRAVECYDRATGRATRLDAARCAFGYRDSIFKHEPDRHIVTAVELRLARDRPANLSYQGLREELTAMGDLAPTSRNVATAVRRIRRRKLPDPAVIGNAGSFFKNPIVDDALATELAARLPGLPVFPVTAPNQRKLSAAWLIEQAGWRGHREGAAGISAQHALVLVNHGGATGAQLLALARRVADSVKQRFGVQLEPEPRIVGARW